MKILTSGLADHYAGGTTTLATALRITRLDGEVYAFHTHDEDKTVDGVVYSSDPGLITTEIVISSGLDVGNLELTTLHDGTIFTPGDILGGRWRNASFLLFRYNWADPDSGIDPLLAGTVGEVEIRQNMIAAELRDLRQYFHNPIVEQSSPTCRYRFGDAKCGASLSDNTVSGTLTHVADAKRVFRDSSRGEAADWFGWGLITFTSGDADGITAKVESYDANGTFTLALPLFVNLQVGDTYTAIAGCRGRFEEDCRDKHANALNFGGEPHRRGMDNVTAGAVPDA